MAEDFAERVLTPAMPICLAYFCCVLNFLIPGTGTVIAGFSIFCCAKNEDMDFGDKCTSCCCGLLIGFLQLVFTAFLLIGWCWSAVWGFSYLEMSRKHYRGNTDGRRIQPITTQPTRRRVLLRPITANQLRQMQLGNYRIGQQVNINIVSQQPTSTNEPPPSYYAASHGHPNEAFEAGTGQLVPLPTRA